MVVPMPTMAKIDAWRTTSSTFCFVRNCSVANER